LGRNERKFVLVGGKASRRAPARMSPRGFALFQAAYAAVHLFSWILPLGCLLASTLVARGCLQREGLSCLRDLTLSSYGYVIFDLVETRRAIEGSLIYGSLGAALILAVTVLCLVSFSRSREKLRAFELLFSSLVATPGAVLALGLIVVLSGRFGLNFYNTPWILVTAYVLKYVSLGFQPALLGLLGISPSLIEAARLSGAGRAGLWRRILFPILSPELMGGFFFVLIPILGELTMSVFLASPSFRPIGAVLFDLQDYADQAAAGALSMLLVVLVLILNETARWLSRGKLGY
jgi:iron(III) transport system permease protein